MRSIRSGLALGVVTRPFHTAVCLAVFMATLPASAAVPSPQVWRSLQEPDPTRDEAAEAFAAGERAFAEQDFSQAVEQFARAQELLPHPYTAYNLGLAQARAGQDIDAWHTFSRLRDETDDPERLTEIEFQLARISPAVARLQIHATEGQVVRIDGSAAKPGVVFVRSPGPLRIEVDAQVVDLELQGGELRHVELRAVDRPAPLPAPNPALTGVLATTVAFGAGTAGTVAAAALLRRDRIGPPLAFTAAGLGGATLALAATALGLHLRERRTRRRR
ncbi:MAG: hypothetical protein ACRBN8_16975 [Nannocystales bacterium]